jgi:hypothetical protein
MNFRHYALVLLLSFFYNVNAQTIGCTDPLSTNYNPQATISDGSCSYANASVAPAASVNLPAAVIETSGLIAMDGYLYTHNDNSDINLYGLDPGTGTIVQTLPVVGTTNRDWEDIAQDDEYLYIGDFGNNSNGNRTNLKIVRVLKSSLQSGSPVTDVINFAYADQTSFAPTGNNNTDFDCEALVVSHDSIYLFTKQWVAKKTTIYALPKMPGTYLARKNTTYNVNGLITGATYLQDKKLVVLCGYSTALQPFFYLLYKFNGQDFFSGNKRKVNISLPFHQVEGVTTTNGLDYYATNERFTQYMNVPHKLHHFNLRPYLENYIANLPGGTGTVWNGSAWSNGIPTSNTYAAVINGDYNSAESGSINANSLTIESGNVVVASGDTFTITGEVSIEDNASLTLEDNGHLIQIDNVQNRGRANVYKYSSLLHYQDYTIWSSPVHGAQTLKNFSTRTLDNRFYVYNTAADSYDNYLSASGVFGGNPSEVAFTAAKGYLIRMPNGLPVTGTSVFEGEFKGTPNNGDITIALNTAGRRFNAVGNPYPSPINIYKFIDANQANLDNGTLYFWRKTNNSEANSYAVITKMAYIANAAEGGDTGSTTFTGDPAQWVINPGQGFIVKASLNAGDLMFNNNMRSVAHNSQFFRTGEDAVPAAAPLSRYWINITGGGTTFAQAAIGYVPTATTGLDYGWDGQLMGSSDTSIYTVAAGIKLGIQARPAFTIDDVVHIGYTITNPGEYTITLHNYDGLFADGQDIVLHDKLLNSVHNLKEAGYTFTSEAGNVADRFEIVYKDNVLGTHDTGIVNPGSVVIYKQGSSLYINGGNTVIDAADIYDVSGKTLYTANGINSLTTVIHNIQVNHQVVFVKIKTTGGQQITKKIVY